MDEMVAFPLEKLAPLPTCVVGPVDVPVQIFTPLVVMSLSLVFLEATVTDESVRVPTVPVTGMSIRNIELPVDPGAAVPVC